MEILGRGEGTFLEKGPVLAKYGSELVHNTTVYTAIVMLSCLTYFS